VWFGFRIRRRRRRRRRSKEDGVTEHKAK